MVPLIRRRSFVRSSPLFSFYCQNKHAVNSSLDLSSIWAATKKSSYACSELLSYSSQQSV